MKAYLLYITCADEAEAKHIGRTVVSKRLAACANVLGSSTSIYWWEGQLEEGKEVILLLKTVEDRLEALIDRVAQLHSYEVPCVEAFPIAQGHVPFLDWLEAETRDA